MRPTRDLGDRTGKDLRVMCSKKNLRKTKEHLGEALDKPPRDLLERIGRDL